MSGEGVVIGFVAVGLVTIAGGATAYRSEWARDNAVRLHHRWPIHDAAKAVGAISLAVLAGVFIDDASVFDSTIHYYAALGAYLGGDAILFVYANVEMIAALGVISRHPDAHSYEEADGAFAYLRRSEALFADWRYLANEHHGGAILAFWMSGALLLLGGFLGLIDGSVPVTIVALVSLALGSVGVVVGGFVGWTRSATHDIKEEAEDHERVDRLVEERRDSVGPRR